MRAPREIMGDLAQTGLSVAQTALMLELMAAVAIEARPSIDVQAERRRAKDRERKRAHSPQIPQNSAETAERAPPNDIYSNPPGLSPASNEAVSLFPEIVVSTWNEMAAANGMQPARKLSPSRLKHLRARVREHSEEAVLEAIRKLGESDWHCGRSSSGWCADLGWLLKNPENFQKILERSSVNGRQFLPQQPGVSSRAMHSFVFDS